jgi:hypothetical protein
MKIWRDTHYFRIFLLICSYIFLLFYLKAVIKYFSNDVKQSLLLILIMCIPILFIINILRTRLTYITSEGIRIGNAPEDTYERIKLPKTIFLSWKEIDKITIINRVVKHNFRQVLRPFLIVKSKKGKRYECFIAQPRSFLEALKKLNKFNLVSKDSKYLDVGKKLCIRI